VETVNPLAPTLTAQLKLISSGVVENKPFPQDFLTGYLGNRDETT